MSRQPPASASPSDSRVTAVITSPDRTNATQWSAAGPSAHSGAYVAAPPKTSGRRARSRSAAAVSAGFSAAGSRGANASRLSGSTSARYSSSVPWYTSGTPGIVRWTRAAPRTFARTCGPSEVRRAATCRPGGPHGPSVTNAATASSYAGSRSVQAVRVPASLTCFSRASRTRSVCRSPAPSSAVAGPSPNTVCHAAHATCGSGTPAPPGPLPPGPRTRPPGTG